MKNDKLLIPNISTHIKEIEIQEVKSLVSSIKENKIELSLFELKHVLNKDLNIQILTNEELNDLLDPIKKFIKE